MFFLLEVACLSAFRSAESVWNTSAHHWRHWAKLFAPIGIIMPGDLADPVAFYSLVGIVLTVVLAGLTIFFSSLIPAVRAGRIPPIVAIRGNDQVKISTKEVKISPLTRKLFGIGGVIAAKNLKRSKSKYRTTVISLVVSIAVFVSISGFVNYMKRSVSYVYTDYDYNLSLTGINDEEKVDDLMREVGESVYASFRLTYAQATGEYASAEMRAYYGDRWDEKIMPTIVIYDDAYFEKYARSEGITSDYRTAAILSDVTILFDENGGRRQIHLYENIEGKTLPVDFTEYDIEADEERVVWTTDITITKLAEKMPMGNEDQFSGNGTIFVAKSFFPAEFYETVPGVGYSRTVVNAQDADACERRIREVMQGSPDYSGIGIYNIEANVRQEHNMILVIEIFLYGFITVITLVGVTNIFNTITTNMILRSKEFAMLKSIGMTTKQFYRMIRLESLLYGMKSLLIGLPIGTAGSYLIYLAFRDSLDMGYLVPWKAMAVSAAAVFVIVGMTMWYSLAKIEKQNIVETIRSDAI